MENDEIIEDESGINKHLHWIIFGGISTFLICLIGGLLVFYDLYISKLPQYQETPTKATPAVYNFDNIAEDIFEDDDANPCLDMYPDLTSRSYSQSLLDWDETKNPTTIMIATYPEVEITSQEGRVIFTSSDVLVQIWVPLETGGRTTQNLAPTDPRYSAMLLEALQKTGGNRGFMSIWTVKLTDNMPGNYTSSGHCEPIPFK